MPRKKKIPRRSYGAGQIELRPSGYYGRYFRPVLIDGRIESKRRVEPLGTFDEAEAIRILDERARVAQHSLPVSRPETVTFADAIDAIRRDYTLRGLRSWPDAERRIRKHLAPHFAKLRVVEITSADVDRYIEARLAAGASPASANRETATLLRMFNILIREKRLEPRHVPAIRKLPEPDARQGFIDSDEIERILAKLPDYLRGPVAFTYGTGARISAEVLAMKWTWVDLEAGDFGRVTIPATAAKNKTERTIYLTSELRAVIDAARAEHDHLFPDCPFVFQRAGQRIRSMRNAWDKACREAGIPGKLRHDMRRSHARNLDRAGVPQSVAQKILGHKTDSVWRRYRIVADEDLQDAARRMSRPRSGVNEVPTVTETVTKTPTDAGETPTEH